MPSKSANVKNEKQYEALEDKGMSKQRAAKIANSPKASKYGPALSGYRTTVKVAPDGAPSVVDVREETRLIVDPELAAKLRAGPNDVRRRDRVTVPALGRGR